MPDAPLIPKRERSPTPPLTFESKTSGVKLVAPLPDACKNSSQNYQQARKQWVRDEVRGLNALGLSVIKILIRDDGLSLEWKSPVPVWPDTLKPACPLSSTRASPINLEDDVDIGDDPGSHHADQEEELGKQASELEDMAIDYLKKYAQTFDSDRVALTNAYANDALFSYCIHEHNSVPSNSVAAAFTNPGAAVQRFAPRKGSRNLVREKSPNNLYSGPSNITTALLSLGPHKFCARSPTDLRWNVLAFQGPSFKPLVFLSSHGNLTEERAGGEKRLSFDQCFLLRRPEGLELNQVSNAEWPLVAVNHQLTVRDLSLRPLAQ